MAADQFAWSNPTHAVLYKYAAEYARMELRFGWFSMEADALSSQLKGNQRSLQYRANLAGRSMEYMRGVLERITGFSDIVSQDSGKASSKGPGRRGIVDRRGASPWCGYRESGAETPNARSDRGCQWVTAQTQRY